MKKLSKLLSVLLCLAMVLGIFTMAVSAAEPPVYTADFETIGVKTSYTTNSTTNGWTATNAQIQTHNDTYAAIESGKYAAIINGKTSTVGSIASPSLAGGVASISFKYANFFSENNGVSVKITISGGTEDVTKTFTVANDAVTQGTAYDYTWTLTPEEMAKVNKTACVVTITNLSPSNSTSNKDRVAIWNLAVTAAEAPAAVGVTGVTVDETATVQAGLSATLTATVAPDNASNKKVTWTSSDETVATVSNGKVVGVKAGTATITVTTEDGSFTDTCAVTITPGPIMLDAPTNGSSYKFGLSQKGLNKYLWFSGEMDGNYLATTENFEEAVDVIPVAVEGGWHISFVKDNATKYIEIYEYSAGRLGVQITDAPTTVHTWDATAKTFFATLAEQTRFMGTYNTYNTISSSETSYITGDNASNLDVSQYVAHLYAIPVTGVTLDKTSQNLTVGGTVDLVATVAPSNATNKAVTWASSNDAVATVANGKVTAVGVGTATITATTADGGKTATCTITVVAATVPATGVTLDKTTATLNVDGEVTLTATVAPADTTDTVTWSTSDANVATVVGGKVTAVGVGTATITAKAGDKTATCEVTVTAPPTPPASTNEGKITSLEDLVTGTYVLVVDTGYAPGVYENGWLTAVQPTIEGDKVTDAKGGIWTLTVADGKVTIKDANGVTVAPKGGNSNGIKEGDYQWVVTCEDGKFIFAGAGEDTVYLASNTASSYGNKFRGYKTSTCKPENTENSTGDYAAVEYPYEFTLYAVTSTGTGSGDTGDTGDSGDTGDTGDTGNTGTGETTKTELTVQNTPTADKAYKFGLYQGTNKTQLWFTGEMDGYYLAMSEDVKDAVDVTVEAVEGGYRLSFTKDGVKKYIDIVERTDKEGSANVVITDEPTAVLTWDATAKTFFAKIGENTFYLGTYNNYKTISASNISYITGDNASKVDVSQYVSHLYLDEPSSTGDAFEPMVIILALICVSALAVLVLNKKKFSF